MEAITSEGIVQGLAVFGGVCGSYLLSKPVIDLIGEMVGVKEEQENTPVVNEFVAKTHHEMKLLKEKMYVLMKKMEEIESHQKINPTRLETSPVAKLMRKKSITANALQGVKLRKTVQAAASVKKKKTTKKVNTDDLRAVKLRKRTAAAASIKTPKASAIQSRPIDSILRRGTLQMELRKKFENTRSPEVTFAAMSPESPEWS